MMILYITVINAVLRKRAISENFCGNSGNLMGGVQCAQKYTSKFVEYFLDRQEKSLQNPLQFFAIWCIIINVDVRFMVKGGSRTETVNPTGWEFSPEYVRYLTGRCQSDLCLFPIHYGRWGDLCAGPQNYRRVLCGFIMGKRETPDTVFESNRPPLQRRRQKQWQSRKKSESV